MRGRLTLGAEAGLGVIEMVVVLAIMAVLIGLTLPGLYGYRAQSAMQTAARQFASDVRAAQEHAIDNGTQNDLVFTTNAGAVTGYTVKQGATVLWSVTLSTQVHATSAWPGNDIAFTSLGSVTGPGASPALCIDNTQGLQITASLVLTTGRVLLTNGTGTCT